MTGPAGHSGNGSDTMKPTALVIGIVCIAAVLVIGMAAAQGVYGKPTLSGKANQTPGMKSIKNPETAGNLTAPGPGHGGPDFAAAAKTLGVTEEALRSALGAPGEGRPDLGTVAKNLGVTTDTLKSALEAARNCSE